MKYIHIVIALFVVLAVPLSFAQDVGRAYPSRATIKPARVMPYPVVKNNGSVRPARKQYSQHDTLYGAHHVSVTLFPGSLRANIIRMARYFGWKKIIWQPEVDFTWVGKTKIVAANFFGVLQQLLADYPLQAQFYKGNHVLVIVARTLK